MVVVGLVVVGLVVVGLVVVGRVVLGRVVACAEGEGGEELSSVSVAEGIPAAAELGACFGQRMTASPPNRAIAATTHRVITMIVQPGLFGGGPPGPAGYDCGVAR